MASFIFRVALLGSFLGSHYNALRLENLNYDGMNQGTFRSSGDCDAGQELFSGVTLDVTFWIQITADLAVCVDETLQGFDESAEEGLNKLGETLWVIIESFMNGALTSDQIVTRDALKAAVQNAITNTSTMIDDAKNFSETIDPQVLGRILDNALLNIEAFFDAWCKDNPPDIVTTIIDFAKTSRDIFDDVATALVYLLKNQDLESALKQIELLTQRDITYGDLTFKIDDKIPEFGLLLGVFLQAYEAMENKKICWRASSSVPSVPAQTCPNGFEYDQLNQRCAPDAYHGRECGTLCPATAGQQCDSVCGAGRWCCSNNNINQAAECTNAKFYTNAESTGDYYQCVTPVMNYMTSSSLMQKEVRRAKAKEAASTRVLAAGDGTTAPTCNLNSEHPILSGLNCESPCPDGQDKSSNNDICLEKCPGSWVSGSISALKWHVCGTSASAIAVVVTDFAILMVKLSEGIKPAFESVTKGNWTGAAELLTSVVEFVAIPKCDGTGTEPVSSAETSS